MSTGIYSIGPITLVIYKDIVAGIASVQNIITFATYDKIILIRVAKNSIYFIRTDQLQFLNILRAKLFAASEFYPLYSEATK